MEEQKALEEQAMKEKRALEKAAKRQARALAEKLAQEEELVRKMLSVLEDELPPDDCHSGCWTGDRGVFDY